MNINNWLKIAEDDLSAAEWNLQGNQYLWCIFMCQQAIEKTLKAIYQFKTHKIPPFKHDLIFLAKNADIIDECSEEIIELFAYLNIHYIETRYSEKRDELKINLTQNNTQDTLGKTRKIFEWLKSKLPE
jgi:HEPN domain-containing protein